MGECYLGLDFGSSGARACVIAAQGEIEELARIDFGGLADHELAAGWRTALLDLLAGLPAGLRRRLAGIAIDATSGTLLACDEALNATAIPLLYDDGRGRTEALTIAGAAGPEHPAATATSGLAKVLWLKKHLAAGRARLFLNQADWLTALLSDRPGISDYHNALKMGFDPVDRAWPEWVDRLANVDTLPKVVPPGSPIGHIARPRARELGIAGDCLIRTGTTDSIAAFLAAGADRPGEAVTSLGSTLVLKLLSETRVDDARYGVYSHWFGRYWLAGGASNAGGRVLRRFFDDAELVVYSGCIDPETDSGLDYYPLPDSGERFPISDPDLPPRLEPRPADRARFLHGLLEGLAGIEARGYRKLAELGAAPPVRVLSSGGGSGNRTYTRLRERKLEVPVAMAGRQEAAYGTARLALHGTCLFPGACHD